MKKAIILIGLVAIIQSCKKEHNNYVTFSGRIENTEDTILIIAGRDFKKNIVINSDGTFNDTLKINNDGYYTLFKNTDRSLVYLKNGFDLKLTADSNYFLESSKYTGYGASSSNYLISQFIFGRSLGNPKNLFALEKPAFSKKIAALKHSFDSIKSLYKDIDTTLLAINDKQNQKFLDYLEEAYDVEHNSAKKLEIAMKSLSKGKPSPKFNNYTNYKGGKLSLDSFKGKYVYIDIWATWCGPCLAEVPALKSVEKQYHGKNIQFVSISIDNKDTAGSWEKANSKWRDVVDNENLTGVQLYAGKDTEFVTDYQVFGIPRFILIDPEGNIVDADAPRPSDPKLLTLFKELGI